MADSGTRQWPTREEWQAKAEYSVRTLCTRWERIPEGTRFITDAEEAEAIVWAVDAAKRVRPALTAEINRLRALVPDRPEKSRERTAWLCNLPEGRWEVATNLSALEEMRRTVARAARENDWGHIAFTLGRLHRGYARIMLDTGLDDVYERLASLAVAVDARREAEARRLEDEAIAREVALRATDEGWQKELEWRARVERPLITRTPAM